MGRQGAATTRENKEPDPLTSTRGTQIVHQIRTGGDDQFEDILQEVVWPEFVHYPGESFEDRLKHWEATVFKKHFAVVDVRAFKVHRHPPDVPVRDDLKYIVVFRSPLDVLASLKPFLNSHTEGFSRTWGGCPPLGQTEEEFYVFALEDQGNGRPGMDQFVYDFANAWWPYRHRPNVLMLHYNDMKLDHAGTIERIAKFMGANLTAEQKKRVGHLTSVSWMKGNPRFDGQKALRPFVERGLLPEDAMAPLKPGTLVRKGEAGSGKEEVSKEMQDRLNALTRDRIKDPALLRFMERGGTFE